MTGAVAITGAAKFGATLTADISGLTNAGTPTYQWNRDGVAIVGATTSTYTLVEADITKVITVTVTAQVSVGTGSATSAGTAAVVKADGPAAPAAPVLVSKTDTSVTLTANALNQFSKDAGATWQDSEVFTGLTAETEYTFVTRIKATSTTNESAASVGTVVTTDAADPEVTGFTFTATAGLKAGEANAAVGQVAGALSAPVGGTGPFIYSLVAGTGDIDNGKFEISGTDLMIEDNPLTEGTYSVRIQIVDSKGKTFTKAVTITVATADPEVTGFTYTATAGLRAGESNAAVGQVAGALSAPVGGTGPFTYSLVAGTGDTDNGKFEITGTDLKIKDNPLTEGTYSVRIQIVDSKGKTFTKTVTITVAVQQFTLTLIGPKMTSSHSVGKIDKGTSITITVTPETGQTVAIFKVGGVHKQAELIGDPLQYTFELNSDTTVETKIKLATVDRPVWSGNNITWEDVDNATEFAVLIYKGGESMGGFPVNPGEQTYDMSPTIERIGGFGKYTVVVCANANTDDGFMHGEFSLPSDEKVINLEDDQSGFTVELEIDGSKATNTEFNLRITGAKTILGNLINWGGLAVIVTSNTEGEVFNKDVEFTNGAATVPIKLVQVGDHTLTVKLDWVTSTKTVEVTVVE